MARHDAGEVQGERAGGEPVCRELLLVDPGDALRAAEFMHRLQPVVVPALPLANGRYLVLLGTMEQMPYPACTAAVLDEKGLEELRRYALVMRVERVLEVPKSLRDLPRALEELLGRLGSGDTSSKPSS
ncbi:hypothetical protein Pyrde_1337 [Pyrodictium delaneyi]|uniref:Uncharacterized protein n=1 Tax=Pyrodictium delaneyi TaxID=1273541 RepID=A0A0P0N3R4_9CREN|nr:hypothetical protein [Pyrodictium delaneyi]ALL01383.1 hypothetical protein Pyrde_1337 [Pyrodictium delaneyi]